MKPRWEDGTSGRPLGDDEDLDPRGYDDVPELEPEDRWDDMSADERRARRAQW